MQALSSDLPSVTQLMIVTANGSIPLFQLTDWTVIDLSVLPPIKIEIQTDRKTVGSVSVVLDGSVMAIRDANPMFVTDQESLSLSTGSHSISITPFSQSNAIGAYGLITTIKFIVANDPTINVVKGMGIFTGKGSSELVLASDEPYPLPIERPHDSLRLRLAVPASYGVSLQITIDNYLFYEISSYPYDLIWSDVQIGIHSFNVVPTIKGVNVPEPTTFYVNVVRGDSYTLPIVPPSIDQFTVYDAVGDYIVANMTDGFVFNAPSITENVVSPTVRPRSVSPRTASYS
uniref:Uncharacterized protein n=1 Tax=Spongospora subterranea TaxID=70186 RepID=A0A0H5RDD4_9EUKA|eukprot:CRZ12013.1 hypothetical protein [Spongospora subterranea]